MSRTDQPNPVTDEKLDEALETLVEGNLTDGLYPAPDELTQRRHADQVIARFEVESASRRRWNLPVIAGAAAASVILGVAGLLWFGSENQGPTVDTEPQQVAVLSERLPKSRFTLLQGEVRGGGMSVELGTQVPLDTWMETGTGQAAFVLPTGIAVGLGDNATARVLWRGHREYAVELGAGNALFSVDPGLSRDGFHVLTPSGRVEVTGTLFSVSVADAGNAEVQVHKGRVRVRTGKGESREVIRSQVATLSPGNPPAVRPVPAEEIEGQLLKIGCLDGGDVFSELSDAHCSKKPTPRKLDPETAAPLEGKDGFDSDAPKKTKAVQPSARELLATARQKQQAGQYNEAAAAWREMIRTHPKNPSSRTARISLARLEFNRLRNPKAALVHYDAYLKSPGPLTQDALHGRALALKALGRTSEERATLEQLVRRFPKGPAAEAANRRLDELGR